jgi:hypothetical protein
MHSDNDGPLPPGANPDKRLTPAARRALEEAAARRAAAGEDDWERKGVAVDF